MASCGSSRCSRCTRPQDCPRRGGPYRIRGTDSDGRALFSLDFTPTEDEYGGKHFFFTVPIEADWEDSLERITLTGPEGLAYVDQADERRITVVTERGTGTPARDSAGLGRSAAKRAG